MPRRLGLGVPGDTVMLDDSLGITVERERGGDCLVGVRGAVDSSSAPELEAVLTELDPPDCKRVVLDLAECSLLASAGLSIIIQTHKRLMRSNGELVLRRPTATIRKVLDITQMSNVLSIEPA